MTQATTRKRSRPGFHCTECGWTATKWVGRCGECQEWGTVTEDGAGTSGPRTAAVAPTRSPALPIGEISADASRATPTGVGEFDRVLGGGLVPGAVVLLAGEPGVGKSTLLLAVASNVAAGAGAADTSTSADTSTKPSTSTHSQPGGPGARRTVLYVTGEESTGQVRLRAERIGALAPGLLLASETDLGTVLGHIEAVDPDLLVIDSVQTIASAEVEGAPGGVAQVREVAAAIIAAAKSRDLPVVLVGHVTKDGSVAGPRTLEHLVDVVCQFEGDRHSRLRLVRAVKNRYGPTDEVGCFDLSERGIVGLADPSGLFLSSTGTGVPGTAITVTLEGRRPLACEIQALTVPSALANPRRTTAGVDNSRLAMILAVMHRHAGMQFADQDVYVSTVGGARVTEPAADLVTALAVFSARQGQALPPGTLAVGEVGLAGDIRAVTGLDRRLGEAARLGFTRAIVPRGAAAKPVPGLTILPAGHLSEAVELAREARTIPST